MHSTEVGCSVIQTFMKSNKINLVFCEENFSTARQIEQDLSIAGFQFKNVTCNPSKKPLAERLHDISAPILILISDNFLKSQKCMQNILPVLQDIVKNNQGQIVVIDGEYQSLDGPEKVPTKFDRVSHVIQYMNYWQDQYLDMRSVKRNIPLQEQEAYDKMLKVIREISGQIGELLRFMKESRAWTFEKFTANNYQLFFKHFGDEKSYQKFCAEVSEVNDNFEDILVSQTKDEDKGPDFIFSRSEGNEVKVKKEKDTLAFKKSDLPTKDEGIILGKVLEYKSQEPPETPAPQTMTSEDLLDKIVDEVVQEETQLAQMTEENNTLTNIEESVETPGPVMLEDKVENPPEQEYANQLYEQQIYEQEEIIINVEDLVDEEDDFDDDFEDEFDDDIQDEVTIDEPSFDLTESLLPETENIIIHTTTAIDPEIQKMEKLTNADPSHTQPVHSKEPEEEQVDTLESILEAGRTRTPFDFSEQPEEETIDKLIKLEEELIEEPPVQLPATDHSEQIVEQHNPVYKISTDFNTKSFLQDIDTLIANAKKEEAFQMLDEALVQFPDNHKLKFRYAVLLDDYKNDTRSAINQLEALIESDPANLKAYLRLAEIAEKHHDFLLAKNYYEKVLQLDSKKAKVHYRLGYIYLNYFQDKEKKAARSFKKAYNLNNKLTDARFQYALLLAHYYGKPVKAIKQFKKIILQTPDHSEAYFELALIYRQLGKRDKAKKFFNKACKIDPTLKTEENKKRFSYKISYRHEPAPKQGFQPEVKVKSPVQAQMQPQVAPRKPQVDKTVFITGATSGIGLATAKVFAENGYRLILGGRRKTKLQTIKQDFIRDFQAEILLLPFDVRNINAMEDAIASLEKPWQQVDILINNAGLAVGKDPIHEGRFEDWNAMIDTNIKGLLYLTRAIVPQMVERNAGHIINLCSSAGHEVYPGGNVYCATKHAVDALTKGMRIDLFRHNIRVSQISPGHVEETEFALVRYKGDKEKADIFQDFRPLKAMDVAKSIYFIASQPDYVTIQDIVLMGTQQASNVFIDDTGR